MMWQNYVGDDYRSGISIQHPSYTSPKVIVKLPIVVRLQIL